MLVPLVIRLPGYGWLYVVQPSPAVITFQLHRGCICSLASGYMFILHSRCICSVATEISAAAQNKQDYSDKQFLLRQVHVAIYLSVTHDFVVEMTADIARKRKTKPNPPPMYRQYRIIWA